MGHNRWSAGSGAANSRPINGSRTRLVSRLDVISLSDLAAGRISRYHGDVLGGDGAVPVARRGRRGHCVPSRRPRPPGDVASRRIPDPEGRGRPVPPLPTAPPLRFGGRRSRANRRPAAPDSASASNRPTRTTRGWAGSRENPPTSPTASVTPPEPDHEPARARYRVIPPACVWLAARRFPATRPAPAYSTVVFGGVM